MRERVQLLWKRSGNAPNAEHMSTPQLRSHARVTDRHVQSSTVYKRRNLERPKNRVLGEYLVAHSHDGSPQATWRDVWTQNCRALGPCGKRLDAARGLVALQVHSVKTYPTVYLQHVPFSVRLSFNQNKTMEESIPEPMKHTTSQSRRTNRPASSLLLPTRVDNALLLLIWKP